MHHMSVARLLVVVAAISATLATLGTARGAVTDPDRIEHFAGRDVAVWLPPDTGGPHPLVLFSHGVRGCSTQSAFLMRALAQDGMLVAAPDHEDKGDDCPDEPPELKDLPPDYLMNPANWQHRHDHLQQLWAALQTDPDYAGLIDPGRVALVGHSLGGYTVLALAGASPTWKTNGIAAVVALAPFAQPLGSGPTPFAIDVPVLFQAGTADKLTPDSVVRGAYTRTAAACIVVYQDADHLAWTGLRPKYQDAVAAATIAFLDEVFAGRFPSAAMLASPQTDRGEQCKQD